MDSKGKPTQLHGAVDRTFEEIAIAMSITEGQVRTLYAHAMLKLRRDCGGQLARMRELARGKDGIGRP